jgi:hypothetical protein
MLGALAGEMVGWRLWGIDSLLLLSHRVQVLA